MLYVFDARAHQIDIPMPPRLPSECGEETLVPHSEQRPLAYGRTAGHANRISIMYLIQFTLALIDSVKETKENAWEQQGDGVQGTVFVLHPGLEEKPRRLHHMVRGKQTLESSIVDHHMQGSAFHASELLSCETLIGRL